jgi:hypothetical protein
MKDKLEIGEILRLEELFGFAEENKNILLLSKKHIETGFWSMVKSQEFKVCDIDTAAWSKSSSFAPISDITIYYIELYNKK